MASNHTLQFKAPQFKGTTVPLDYLIELRLYAQGLTIANPKKVNTEHSGEQATAFRGRGIDFAEFRNYQPGDDIRNMDWRVTARTGRPHIKLYREERERPIFIVIDYHSSMFFGTKVTFKASIAAQAAALLAWACAKNGDRVGGFIFSGQHHIEFKPQIGKHGVLPLLKAIADQQHTLPTVSSKVKEENPKTLTHALKRLRHIVRPGSLVFLLSDLYTMDTTTTQQLQLLAQHNHLFMQFIYDPLEKHAPPPNRYGISDGQQIMTFTTYSQEFCLAYQQHFQQRYLSLKKICQQYRIPLLSMNTTDSVVNVLFNYFGKTRLEKR